MSVEKALLEIVEELEKIIDSEEFKVKPTYKFVLKLALKVLKALIEAEVGKRG